MKNLKKNLNLNYTDITGQVHKIGKYDIPYTYCNISTYPDYFALYSEVGDYKKTSNTCVCFFQDDIKFDGLFGIWNAIYYNDELLLNHYKQRFAGVKYMISPDYSLVEDIENFENYYRIAKERIVSAWATLELGTICIPLLTFSKKEDFPLMITGMSEVTTVCVSLKGSMDSEEKSILMKSAINFATDHLKKLTAIIVYSVSIDSKKEQSFFLYPISKGIKIIFPENSLRIRNRINCGNLNGKN